MGRRIRLLLEYDGTEFSGSQRQREGRTVLGELERRLAEVLGHPVKVTAAGRTDAGVHALGQVAHFDSTGRIAAERIPDAVNGRMGPGLVVRRAEDAPPGFHARYGALRRTYRYYVSRELPSPFLERYVLFERRLCEDAEARIARALPALLGTHAFTTFAAAGLGRESAARTVKRARAGTTEGLLIVELTADSFLRRMVRSIVGLLLEIGRGEREPEALGEALAARDRRAAGRTAPPHGLFLVRVEYADGFGAGDAGALRSRLPALPE